MSFDDYNNTVRILCRDNLRYEFMFVKPALGEHGLQILRKDGDFIFFPYENVVHIKITEAEERWE